MTNALQMRAPAGLPFLSWTREFPFSVASVFATHSDPDQFAEWWGPHGTGLRIHRHDFTTGGAYSYRYTAPGGEPLVWSGVFHTVRHGEIVVQTSEFSGIPDSVALEFLRFEPAADGGTRLRGHRIYPTQQARDDALAASVGQGLAAGFDRLEDLLASDGPGASILADFTIEPQP